jgi:NAD(P)-dependent dehydrogenase (short-subunit alcohol dehydrogenase family)
MNNDERTSRFPWRVVVTGGATGIGWAISEHFARTGCAVTVVDLSGGEISARQAEGAPESIEWVADDIARSGVADEVLDDLKNRLGGIDVLVNNAAVSRYQHVLDISPESWRRTIEVNLGAAFFWSQSAARLMRAAGIGRIINMGSVNSFAAEPDAAPYVAAKAGLLGLTRAFAVDLAGTGVTINAVCPGPIGTARNTAMFADEPLRTQLARVPVGRLGKPDEVVSAISWLASTGASFVNGQAIVVDGGLLARI